MPTPEAIARQNIDAQLAACGWVVQDRSAMNLYAGRGVAVRKFPLETGYADYYCSWSARRFLSWRFKANSWNQPNDF